MGMNKLLDSKKKMKQINKKNGERRKVKPISKNKSKTQSKQENSKQKLSFEERHKRLTTYVENKLYDRIQRMKDTGQIRTITEFVNNAFKEYIKQEY